MVSTALVLAFSLVAAITDLWKGKIHNGTTYPGILCGFVLGCLEPGGIGWESSLWGILGCGGLSVVCFVLFGIGGGDVKLLTMLGAFLGWPLGLACLLWTFVLGAGFGVGTLVWRVGAMRMLSLLSLWFWSLVTFRQRPVLAPEEQKLFQTPLCLGPAAPLAVYLVKFAGWV